MIDEKNARKPEWLKIRPPAGEAYLKIKDQLRSLKLYTVCEEARCPNMGECWSGGTATIMLLGDVCTRGCRFCAVKTGRPGGVVDQEEPVKVGGLVAESGLEYVVLTSVNRDDLPDGGASHFAQTIRAIKSRKPKLLCEALVPDFQGDRSAVQTLIESGLDVYAHNIETVRRLTPRVRDRRATYDQSLGVLRAARELAGAGSKMLVKTSIQLGHGETEAEVFETLRDLRAHAVDVVTFGQYLRPSIKHLPVVEFISPEKFKEWELRARDLGFVYVASGALVRSSYRAGEFYLKGILTAGKNEERTNNGGF